PITHVGQSRCSPSRETAAHDRLKSPLTISEMRTNLPKKRPLHPLDGVSRGHEMGPLPGGP
ncbi:MULTISPECIES: hypothetical protein, partial [unclassified Bradyrhizobium]|uniref:hypothetical protein n=1 Tax=unclassified Bradyrhizobium TaxID=2631580 RepID=UPI001FF7646F